MINFTRLIVYFTVHQHTYRSVNSMAAVLTAFGDAYFWDNTARTLYLRVVYLAPTFGNVGTDPAVWTRLKDNPTMQFSRGGLTLHESTYVTLTFAYLSVRTAFLQFSLYDSGS